MKKSLKIFALFIMLALPVAMLSACKFTRVVEPTTTTKQAAESAAHKAAQYLKGLYTLNTESTRETVTKNLTRPLKYTDESVTYTWTVNVTEDKVKVVPDTEKGTVSVVIVDVKTATGFDFNLTNTISDGTNTETLTWYYKVPAFKELTYQQYHDANKNDPVVVKGVVTALIGKSVGASYNCIFFQDADGAYYAYDMEADPTADTNLQVGMTIRVSGVKDIYSGTHEIKEATYEILDTTVTLVEAADYTALYTNATELTDATLVDKQSSFVKLNGVTIAAQDDEVASGYYKFSLAGKTSYVRISSSVCPIPRADQAAFIDGHKNHTGWTANVCGILTLFNGSFYLTPVTANAIEYISLPELSDADAVAFEKESLKYAAEITKAGEYDLQVKGAGYEKVTITWVSDKEFAVVADGKLTVTLPDEETTLTLTATLTAGEATDTKEFKVKVSAAIANYLNAAQVIALAQELDPTTNEKSEGKYFIYGVVVDDPTTDYCNFHFSDGENQIVVYGLYAANGTDRYGTKRQIAEIPFAKGDTVYVYGQLQNYGGTLEIINAILQEAPAKGSNPANPFGAADAITEAGKLDSATNEKSEGKYFITAEVVDTPTADYCNFHFSDGENEIVVYGLYAANETDRYGTKRQIAEIPFGMGYTVTVYGQLQNYGGTLEIINAVLVSYEAPKPVGAEEVEPASVEANANKLIKLVNVKVQDNKVAKSETVNIVFYTDQNCQTAANLSGMYYYVEGYALAENDSTINFYVTNTKAYHAGTLADPYTVEDAIALARPLEKTYYDSTNKVTVLGGYVEGYFAGIVKAVGSYDASKHFSSNIYLVDDAESKTSLLVYTVNDGEGMAQPCVGDTVIIKGYIVNYNGSTPEVTSIKPEGSENTLYPEVAAITRGNGTIAVAETSSDKATVELSKTSGQNMSTFTFTVTVAEGYEIDSVTVNGAVVEAAEGTYTGTITGATSVSVSTVEKGKAPVLAASISFASITDENITYVNPEGKTDADKAATQMTWVQNGITFIVEKGTSSTSCNNNNGTTYYNPIRIYKNQKVTVQYNKMVKIVIECNNENYAKTFNNLTFPEGVTVKVEGKNVTFTFAEEVNEFSYIHATDATRFNKIDIYTLPTE